LFLAESGKKGFSEEESENASRYLDDVSKAGENYIASVQ
jgi:hypothetical protein